MASHLQTLLVGAFKSDGVIAKGKAVKMGTDEKHVAKATAATDKVVGLCMGDVAAADDACEVAMFGGAKGLLGGVVAAGDFLVADANGALVATTTANDKVIAQALEAGVADDLIGVLVCHFNY